MDTKKLSELEVLESAEGTRVLVEVGGKQKRVPAGALGKVKTVNGAEPDENGNVTVEIPESPDWVARKTQTGGDTVYIPKQTLSSGMWSNLQAALQVGAMYDVTFNGEVYSCVARAYGQGAILGNDTDMALNDYPFCIMWAGGTATSGMFFKRGDISWPVTLKVTDHVEVVYDKMPEGYLPDGVVESVNGIAPDENGNVEVEAGGVDVTASVGQTIVVEEVDANGKPTKWKAAEYQEKICGTGLVELLNTTIVAGAEQMVGLTIKEGETYYVTFNGVEYTCVGTLHEVDGEKIIAIGGENGTGEPFAIVSVLSAGVTVAIIMDEPIEQADIVVRGKGYIPIPVQYVTNALPYYIEVTDEGTTDSPYVCADTVANVEAIFASGRPIALKLRVIFQTDIVIIHNLWLYGTNDTGHKQFVFISGSGLSIGEVHRYMTLFPQEDGTYAVSLSSSGIRDS